MTTSRGEQLVVRGIRVAVVRKPIKSLRFAVQPPHGSVRVSAPLELPSDVIRLAVIDKLPWIRRQRATFDAQPRQTAREMVTGETHYVFGRSCRLRVVEHQGPIRIGARRPREL